MQSTKAGKTKTVKEKKKLISLIENSDSEDGDSEHELSHYVNDRVKLMKEVLKIIKPKKIKSMAPDCIRNLDLEEINSMLLEELLGISNKRLKYIFNGQSLDEDSSSTDPEQDNNPIDIISLDDISDDDFVIEIDSDNQKKSKDSVKIKKENCRKKIKKEKIKLDNNKGTKPQEEKTDQEKLMSVLELLELQARARAIRSQLALENTQKAKQPEKPEENTVAIEDDDEDAVIVQSPKKDEIVISSSDSEDENTKNSSPRSQTLNGNDTKIQDDNSKSDTIVETENKEVVEENIIEPSESVASIMLPGEENINKISEKNNGVHTETTSVEKSNNIDNDEIVVINVDQSEIDGIASD